jgi:hypothetical protein
VYAWNGIEHAELLLLLLLLLLQLLVLLLLLPPLQTSGRFELALMWGNGVCGK